MAEQKILIAGRKKNGQIGYLSEGLSLPEFFNLLKPRGDIKVLVDYSPVIEELHKLHRSDSSEELLIKYNAMYNYWQEAKTYKKESIKISKSEELSKQANFLINELHVRLPQPETEFNTLWMQSLHESLQIAEAIKKYSDIYIDTLLCFIHTKASLDIESFKEDVVLSEYSKFLYDYISSLYHRLLGEGRYRNSFLKFIAIEQPDKLQQYLDLEEESESSDQFLLQILKSEKPYDNWNEDGGCHRQISIRYDIFDSKFISLVEIFKNLLSKASSIKKFIATLKEGGYEWDDSADVVDALRADVHLLSK